MTDLTPTEAECRRALAKYGRPAEDCPLKTARVALAGLGGILARFAEASGCEAEDVPREGPIGEVLERYNDYCGVFGLPPS